MTQKKTTKTKAQLRNELRSLGIYISGANSTKAELQQRLARARQTRTLAASKQKGS